MTDRANEAWEQGPGLVSSLWRYRWLILAVAVVSGVAGYGLSTLQPTTYSATASAVLNDPTSARNVFSEGQAPRQEDVERHVLKQAERMTSRAVLLTASEQLGGTTLGELESAVSVEAEPDRQRVTITATAGEPDAAANRANAVVEAYMNVSAGEAAAQASEVLAQLEATKATLTERIESLNVTLTNGLPDDDVAATLQRQSLLQQLVALETTAQELTVNASIHGSGVDYFEPALVPDSPASPAPLRNGLLAAMLGAAAAGAFGWWRMGKDHGASTSDAPEPVLEAPLLGQIPDLAPSRLRSVLQASSRRPLLTDRRVEQSAGEAYHFLVTSLEFALGDTRPRAVLVTSAAPGEGKTSVVTNTALAAAAEDRRVIVVDADHRQRGLSRLLGLDDAPGLSDFVISDLGIEECMHVVELGPNHRLCVVPAGTRLDHPSQLFRLPSVRKAMMRIREEAELVLVDSAPALSVADTTLLASEADGIVVVVKRGTELERLEAARDRLSMARTPLLGYVYNRAIARDMPYSYYPTHSGT